MKNACLYSIFQFFMEKTKMTVDTQTILSKQVISCTVNESLVSVTNCPRRLLHVTVHNCAWTAQWIVHERSFFLFFCLCSVLQNKQERSGRLQRLWILAVSSQFETCTLKRRWNQWQTLADDVVVCDHPWMSQISACVEIGEILYFDWWLDSAQSDIWCQYTVTDVAAAVASCMLREWCR